MTLFSDAKLAPAPLEILIRQVREDGEIDPILGKALRILGHAKLFQPVCNLLHAPPSID